MRNHWVEHAELLAAAYLESDASLCHSVVNHALRRHIRAAGPDSMLSARVLDIGGGQAIQARALARAGHVVTVLDLDERMLAAAEAALSSEHADVRERVKLLCGRGEDAAALAGIDFDLVCCHSVLMYLEDPQPLVDAIVNCARPGGLLSVLSLNADAIAMRAGLQGRWSEAVEALRSGRESGSTYLPTQEPPLREVRAWFERRGATMLTWYGVGIFTDHCLGPIRCDDPSLVVEAEWRAGELDPYRGVARCFHLLMHR